MGFISLLEKSEFIKNVLNTDIKIIDTDLTQTRSDNNLNQISYNSLRKEIKMTVGSSDKNGLVNILVNYNRKKIKLLLKSGRTYRNKPTNGK